jgi:pSer/pThr/pTyr-binding forkhead associated (FHA) protein
MPSLEEDREMKLRLVSLDYRVPQGNMTLDRLPVTIGQADDADIRLQDPSVSKYHCDIVRVDDMLVVRDLGSRHGTRVNGSRVHESALLPGDELAVGMMTFLVQALPSDVPVPPRARPSEARVPVLQ